MIHKVKLRKRRAMNSVESRFLVDKVLRQAYYWILENFMSITILIGQLSLPAVVYGFVTYVLDEKELPQIVAFVSFMISSTLPLSLFLIDPILENISMRTELPKNFLKCFCFLKGWKNRLIRFKQGVFLLSIMILVFFVVSTLEYLLCKWLFDTDILSCKSGNFEIPIISTVISICTGIYISVRGSLVFAGHIVNNDRKIRNSWVKTKGSFWKLGPIYLLFGVMFLIMVLCFFFITKLVGDGWWTFVFIPLVAYYFSFCIAVYGFVYLSFSQQNMIKNKYVNNYRY